MSARWFRFYADALRNPKVASLSDKEFRLWVRLLALASESDGVIPDLPDLKRVLNARLDHLLTGVERLLTIGLIDRLETGYEPHNWSKFQYKSDTSTDRVHKHRAKRNVSETPPDTDTDTEEKKEEEKKEESAPVAAPDYAFEGRVIRLNEMDFRRWIKSYPALDIRAVLQARDDWLGTQPDERLRKSWFHSTSSHLANLQQKAAVAFAKEERMAESPC